MKNLSHQQFKLAVAFIKEKARPLDRALYEYEFENGSKDSVIEELVKFQNPDGGFGNGLEPDFRTESSSALASSVALQVLSTIGANSNDEIVKNVIGYLLKTYNDKTFGWEKVPKDVENAPRAPWWNYQEPRSDWGNPNAELLGYFYQYQELIPSTLLQDLSEYAITYFNNLKEFEFHEVLCFLRLAERIPANLYKTIETKLIEALNACVVTNPAKWTDYGLQPVQLVTSPQSRFVPLFSDSIEDNIQFVIEQQNQDGTWSPSWSWFGQYEDDWQVARHEWQGNITLNHLILLRNFNRIEFI